MADDMRTLGYICPKCGAQVMGARSVFALEASDAEIECSCGGSVLRTNYDGQNYHILVPCGVCGQTHEAVCPPERMLHAATALSCPDSKQFCCFIGDEGTVEHHLREASIAISKEKAQENSGEAEAFTDNVIMYEFLSELKDIAARPNGITCGCGSHDYSMEIRRDAVELTCRDCGARLRLSAATDRDLDDLCCHMKLVIPGGKRPSPSILKKKGVKLYDLASGPFLLQKRREKPRSATDGLRYSLRRCWDRAEPAAVFGQVLCRDPLRLRRHHGGRLQQPL